VVTDYIKNALVCSADGFSVAILSLCRAKKGAVTTHRAIFGAQNAQKCFSRQARVRRGEG